MATNLCNLCNEISNKKPIGFDEEYYKLIISGENKILETDNFVVIPSAGPLNYSHIMLVPKIHINCFAELSAVQRNEGLHILEIVNSYYRKTHNKNLVFFESGAGKLVDHSGGCIIHSHIHCVEESDEFHSRLLEEINFKRTNQNDHSTADIIHGYVWYKDKSGDCYICNNPLLPSQFLRYLYSQYKGDATKWNWRRDINIFGIKAVLNNYKNIERN